MNNHILFIVENATVPFDVRVWSEALTAKELGYDVSIIAPLQGEALKKHEIIDDIEIYRHPSVSEELDTKFGFLLEYSNAIFWEILLSLKIFIKKPFQIIHGANPPDHIFLIAIFYKMFGVKYIFDHHDLTPENYEAIFQKPDFLHQILLYMEKLSFRSADVVISTNESYKNIARERGGKSENDIFVVRNGPDLSRYKIMPPKESLREGFDYLVAYLGVIGRQEGIDNLLRSVCYLIHEKKTTNIKFIIVGKGPNQQEMVKMAEEMGLSGYVHFTGYVPYDNLFEILSTADLCVNPEFRNPFTDKSTMIKIMDYMVFGKPIVQFRTTEGEVTAGDAAKYVERNSEIDFAEAIVEILEDPDTREKMGKAGRARIDRMLNWEFQKQNLKNAYKRLEAFS